MRKLTATLFAGTMAALMTVGMVGCGPFVSHCKACETRSVSTKAENKKSSEMSADFAKRLEEVYNIKFDKENIPATAKGLVLFMNTYADQISYQVMEEIAKDAYDNMQNEYGDTFADEFADAFHAVVDEAYNEDEGLETDVVFCQIVNSVENLLSGADDVESTVCDEYYQILDDSYMLDEEPAKEDVENVSLKLVDFVVNYGEGITYQDMEEITGATMKALNEAHGECTEKVVKSFETVAEYTLENHEDFEGDLAFNQVVNSVMNYA